MSGFNELPDLYELWDYNRPEETEMKFLKILSEARDSGNFDYLGQLLTQIARTRVFLGDIEGARKLLDEADATLTGECKIGKIRSILERGRTYQASGEMKKAEFLFLKACDQSYMADALEYTVDAAHMLAILSEPEEAIKWNDFALKLTEDSDKERVRYWQGSLFNNIGWEYHKKGDYDSAYLYFKKSLTFHVEKKRPDRIRFATFSISHTLRSMAPFEEALMRLRQLMENYESEGVDESGFIAEEIGECLWAFDKKEEARPYLVQAYEKLRTFDWLVKEAPESIESLKERGEVKDGRIDVEEKD
jgi:tetratricopeptide (TPR) repeat protein